MSIPVVIAAILAVSGFKFVVPVNVFESLLQVISIIFGFSIVGIFFYLGRIDSYEKDYLQTSGREYAQLTKLRKAAEKRIRDFEKNESQADKIEEIRKLLNEVAELQKKLKSRRENFAEVIGDLRGAVISWADIAITGFGIGIAIAVYAMLASEVGLREYSYTYLSTIAGIVLSVTLTFLQLWGIIHRVMDRLSNQIIETENSLLFYEE